MTRAAGVLAVLVGLGFGIPGVIGARYFAQHHEVWQFLGFPTYGGGPFERADIPTTVPLLVGFVLVCAAEVAIGGLLLANWHPALWLSLAILPFELVYLGRLRPALRLRARRRPGRAHRGGAAARILRRGHSRALDCGGRERSVPH